MVASLLSENCASRFQSMVGTYDEPPAPRRRPLTMVEAEVPGASYDDRFGRAPRVRATPVPELPADFFERLAELAANDPFLAAHLDDPLSSLLWGKPKTLQCEFLQMCIRERADLCRDLWWQLQDADRLAWRTTYWNGPSSPEFFANIAQDEPSTAASSREGTILSGSMYAREMPDREATWMSDKMPSENSWPMGQSRENSIRESTREFSGPTTAMEGMARRSRESSSSLHEAVDGFRMSKSREGKFPTSLRELKAPGSRSRETMKPIKEEVNDCPKREWTGRSHLSMY